MAMTAIVSDAPVELSGYAAIFCRADSVEDLFVAWLNAVTYEMAVRDMIFGAFVVRIGGERLCGAAYGEIIDVGRHQPACEIKGATYTELAVKQSENGLWLAQCVVDV